MSETPVNALHLVEDLAEAAKNAHETQAGTILVTQDGQEDATIALGLVTRDPVLILIIMEFVTKNAPKVDVI